MVEGERLIWATFNDLQEANERQDKIIDVLMDRLNALEEEVKGLKAREKY